MNKGRLAVVITFCLVLLASYTIFIPQTRHLLYEYNPSMQEHLVDAIVLIAMGKMAEDPMVDFSISSIRKMGNWKGDIYLLTDRSKCFLDAVGSYDLKLVEMPPLATLIEIKALKPKLLQFLPEGVKGALYLDVDIIVTRDLGSFLLDLRETVQQSMSIKKLKLKIAADKQRKSRNIDPEISFSSNYSQPNFDYGAFLDAKGHYVGFCSGCEKWHTGVVWLQRHSKETMALTTSTSAGAESVTEDTSASAILSKKLDGTSKVSQIGTGTGTGTDICMRAWETILLSGRYNTDQESLDEAERSGACPSALVLPAKHLLFAKDYIGMALTAGQTFLHLTAAGRLESQDYFYREIVVPRLRNSLRPTLNPGSIKNKKVC